MSEPVEILRGVVHPGIATISVTWMCAGIAIFSMMQHSIYGRFNQQKYHHQLDKH